MVGVRCSAAMRILETDRLRLRWFDAGDAAFVLALVNDPAWIANIGDRGLRNEDDARGWIAQRLVRAYVRDGFGLWAIERKYDGALVGMCGFVDRDSLPAIDLGYALAPAFRGEGYACEAARASIAYGRDVLGVRRVLALVKPGNLASLRVLAAVGMRAEGTHQLPGEAEPDALFSWDAGGDDIERDDERAIDGVARRLFAYFSNRGVCHVAAVPSLFAPGAVISVIRSDSALGIESLTVPEFVRPRAVLLTEGRLVDFEERETASETKVVGSLAHRASRYEKSGILDGAQYRGRGTKHLQLVRTRRGWKIAALAWEDDP